MRIAPTKTKKCFILYSCLFMVFITTSVLTVLPSAGTNVYAAEISVAWDQNPEEDIAGYKIYYGFQKNMYNYVVNAGLITSYTLTGLEEGRNYYLALTAYNTSGLESDYSEEIHFIIHNPEYDGNKDGIPDIDQDNVVSCKYFGGQSYITIVSDEGTILDGVEFADLSENIPQYNSYPYGLIGFTVRNLGYDGKATVSIYLPEGGEVDAYYKYGPQPGNTSSSWYEFVYDGETGAEFEGNRIILHFVDGKRGDGDLDTTNRIIVDPGSPAIIGGVAGLGDSTSDGGSGGGGCFIATAAYGSYIEPKVMILRGFRDNVLLKNTVGRSFVKLYYRLSPPAANYIAKHDALRSLTRFGLTPLIYAVKYPSLFILLMILTGCCGSIIYVVRRLKLRK